MATNETKLDTLVIHELTKAEYDSIANKEEHTLYVVTDDNTYPTTEEVDAKLDLKLDSSTAEATYAKKDELPTTTSELTNNSGFITKDVDNLVNYYKKDETYTKAEVIAEIPTKVSELTNDVNMAKTNVNNNFSTAQTINGTLTVVGDIVQNGSTYETHAEQLFTKNDVIITRDGAVGGLGADEVTGIQATKYDGTNDGQLVFDANGVARVGDVGDTQPLLTRAESTDLTDGQVLTWDSTNAKAVGSNDFIKNTDYASSTEAGVIKAVPSRGLEVVSSTGVLNGLTRTNTEYEADLNSLIISKGTLNNVLGNYVKNADTDSVVKEGLANNSLTMTADEQLNSRNFIGTGTYRGIYDENTTYYPGDSVVHGSGNTIYFCRTEAKGIEPTSINSYWVSKMAIAGIAYTTTTQPKGTNDTAIANTKFVQQELADYIKKETQVVVTESEWDGLTEYQEGVIYFVRED